MENQKPGYYINTKRKIIDFAFGIILGIALLFGIGYFGFFALWIWAGASKDISNGVNNIIYILACFLFYSALVAFPILGKKFLRLRRFVFIGMLSFAASLILLPNPCSIYSLYSNAPKPVLKENNSSCVSNSECVSDICYNNVCCQTPLCRDTKSMFR